MERIGPGMIIRLLIRLLIHLFAISSLLGFAGVTGVAQGQLTVVSAASYSSRPLAAEEIVAALPAQWVRFERFAGVGHGAWRDDPEAAERVLRRFLTA